MRSLNCGMMRLEDLAASRGGGEDAVGDVAGLHGLKEFIDDLVPRPRRRERVSLVVGDYFHIALAK